jgi:hypothetical protein
MTSPAMLGSLPMCCIGTGCRPARECPVAGQGPLLATGSIGREQPGVSWSNLARGRTPEKQVNFGGLLAGGCVGNRKEIYCGDVDEGEPKPPVSAGPQITVCGPRHPGHRLQSPVRTELVECLGEGLGDLGGVPILNLMPL